jgi:hypothetical protein
MAQSLVAGKRRLAAKFGDLSAGKGFENSKGDGISGGDVSYLRLRL